MKFNKIAIFMIIFIFGNVVSAKHLYLEKDYQTAWCGVQGGTMEYHLSDSTRVDCVTPLYAIEVGFVDHKYEDVGQSLYYALKTNRKPGILTIVENYNKNKNDLAIEKTLCNRYGIQLWVVGPDYLQR